MKSPVRHLDFESFMPAIPRFAGTGPFDAVPFLFSVHTERNGKPPLHMDYLHEGDDDPRPRLADRLIEALGSEGSVCTYSGYERRMIRELAEALPDRAGQLRAIEARLVDLHPVVRDGYYHPAFRGSFSIKKVLPALRPGMGYDDLAIAARADGSGALRLGPCECRFGRTAAHIRRSARLLRARYAGHGRTAQGARRPGWHNGELKKSQWLDIGNSLLGSIDIRHALQSPASILAISYRGTGAREDECRDRASDVSGGCSVSWRFLLPDRVGRPRTGAGPKVELAISGVRILGSIGGNRREVWPISFPRTSGTWRWPVP